MTGWKRIETGYMYDMFMGIVSNLIDFFVFAVVRVPQFVFYVVDMHFAVCEFILY